MVSEESLIYIVILVIIGSLSYYVGRDHGVYDYITEQQVLPIGKSIHLTHHKSGYFNLSGRGELVIYE